MESFSYRIVEEEAQFFDLPDGKRLMAKLHGKLQDRVAVIVHGRPGSGDYEPYRIISRYLDNYGIPTLRLSLYSDHPDTRDIQDCSLETNATDLEAVIGDLRPKVGSIALVAHSYSAMASGMLEHNKPDVAVWLDPSHGSYWQNNSGGSEIKVGDHIIYAGGAGYTYPASYQEYDRQLGDTSYLAKKLDRPLKIISAGKGSLTEYGELYYQAANEPKSHVVIPDADHGFTNSDAVTLQACQEIYSWIDEHMPTANV